MSDDTLSEHENPDPYAIVKSLFPESGGPGSWEDKPLSVEEEKRAEKVVGLALCCCQNPDHPYTKDALRWEPFKKWVDRFRVLYDRAMVVRKYRMLSVRELCSTWGILEGRLERLILEEGLTAFYFDGENTLTPADYRFLRTPAGPPMPPLYRCLFKLADVQTFRRSPNGRKMLHLNKKRLTEMDADDLGWWLHEQHPEMRPKEACEWLRKIDKMLAEDGAQPLFAHIKEDTQEQRSGKEGDGIDLPPERTLRKYISKVPFNRKPGAPKKYPA